MKIYFTKLILISIELLRNSIQRADKHRSPHSACCRQVWRGRCLSGFATSLIIISSLAGSVFALEDFIPWGSDVRIADENLTYKAAPRERKTNIFNSPQTASYVLIRFFQVFISPQDGPNCRYSPTCSLYGSLAIRKFGALLGIMLTGDRLIRCNPFEPIGDDSLPDSFPNHQH